MVTLLRVSLQPHPLRFHRTTTSAAAAALRMIPSPTSTRSPKPNFSIPMTPPTSEITSKSTNFPITKDSTNSLFNSQRFTHSECFYTPPAAKPITVAESECVSEIVECPLVVVSFYKFADFPDHADSRKPLKELCERLRVSGGIILAPEGINGSICGTRNCVDEVLTFIQTDDRLKGLRCIESPVSPEEEAMHHGHMSSSPLAAGEDAPFRWDHVRVKLKKEIVTLGRPSVSPNERVGQYVCPKEWNNLISDPDTVVVDVRNDYETRIGKFKQAVDPCTKAFREFPEWVEERFKSNEPKNLDNPMDEQIDEMKKKMPRVAMYCTGGIRCEKASSFLLGKGFKEVYHLQGGILKYLEEVPKAESLWEGECFVFDKRVSVEHGLTQGTYKLCYGCKQPVSDADMETPEWEYGVTCPYCYSSKSEEEKDRARARQMQFERWGIIGGPDKGHKPAIMGAIEERQAEQMPGSVL